MITENEISTLQKRREVLLKELGEVRSKLKRADKAKIKELVRKWGFTQEEIFPKKKSTN